MLSSKLDKDEDCPAMYTTAPAYLHDECEAESDDGREDSWRRKAPDRAVEQSAPPNTIFLRWRNVIQFLVCTWLFDGWPVHSMLEMVAHCLGHEIIHCLINACCSRPEQVHIHSVNDHSERFQILCGNILGHPSCTPDGCGWHDHDVGSPDTVEQAWRQHIPPRPKSRAPCCVSRPSAA